MCAFAKYRRLSLEEEIELRFSDNRSELAD